MSAKFILGLQFVKIHASFRNAKLNQQLVKESKSEKSCFAKIKKKISIVSLAKHSYKILTPARE